MKEETGIDIRVREHIGETRYRFGPGLQHRKRVEWFVAEQVAGTLTLEAIFSEGAFVDEEEATARLTHEADRSIVTRAFAVARGWG